MTSAAARAPAARDEVTLLHLFDVLSRHRRLVVAMVLAGLLAGMAFMLLVRPTWQADMLIQLDDAGTAATTLGLPADMANLFDVKTTAAAEAQILASRRVLAGAVTRLRLHIEVLPGRWAALGVLRGWLGERVDEVVVEAFDVPAPFEGEAFRLTVLPDGRHWRLDGPGLGIPVTAAMGVEHAMETVDGPWRIKVIDRGAAPGAQFTVTRRSRLSMVAATRDQFNVQEKVRQSGVLVATLRGTDRALVTALLREIGDQYVRQSIEQRSAEAAQSLLFLDRQLPDLKRQLEAAQERYTSMTERHGIADLAEEARLALKAAAEARTQLLWLTQKREELVTRFTRHHASVTAIDRQMDAVRRQLQQVEGNVRGLPALQRQVAELTLDVRVATDLYMALLGSAQQLELVKAGQVAGARVVDMAEAGETPIAPKWPLALGMGLLGGLVLGAGLAFARDWFAGGVCEPEEIEAALGVSVLAMVPRTERQRALDVQISRGEGGGLLSGVAPDDPAVESLRSLRTALRLTRLNQQRRVVLVTGSEPGSGKSFIATNLAALLGADGLRVLLVDIDTHCGRVHEAFRLPAAPGTCEVVDGALSLDAAVHRGVAPGLDVLTQGQAPGDGVEPFAGGRLAEFLAQARFSYDAVVIDAPPVQANTNAVLFARNADLVLLVARDGHSRMGDLRESVRRLRLCGIELDCAVLNGVTPRLGRYGGRFGAYGTYGYGGYGRYGAGGRPPGRLGAWSARLRSLWRGGRRQ
ncbi:GNVR domain-containing protein [Cupriavidus agavae]|uniref:Tyrosine-protein kinase Etk/Wzc n=1 Tax=Cupriavidus agavae TaxID=1001822 RepID=A0A4Q7SA70_9BURK|nr:GNVR domain-containing protein [Cupriavidus agavae]RZT42332.1 tyrosine-protein kinase Etk/Wzc [Cupriavidus agavae]